MRLAAFLLALIAAVHFGYPLLAASYADPEEAGRVIFYAARGVEGTALFLLVGLFARRRVVWAVCLWGAVEESQSAICQLAIGIEKAPAHEMFEGICGKGYYMMGLIAVAALATRILDREKKDGVA